MLVPVIYENILSASRREIIIIKLNIIYAYIQLAVNPISIDKI